VLAPSDLRYPDGSSAGSRPVARRKNRRARRLRWAASLAALGAAAAFASSQAAAQERSTELLRAAAECASTARLGYDVAWSSELASFALEGVHLNAHRAECAGSGVVVVVSDAEGRPLASGTLELGEGASVRFDTSAPVDAREVAAVQVFADL